LRKKQGISNSPEGDKENLLTHQVCEAEVHTDELLKLFGSSRIVIR